MLTRPPSARSTLRAIAPLVLGVLVAGLIALFAPATAADATTSSTVVSRLVAGREIQVDGVPFNPLPVQYRVDRALRYDGLTLSDTAAFYADAKRLGFNTISIPLPWNKFETGAGLYDYTWLDSFVDNAKANGLELEVIWFGSNVGGAGASNFMPQYIQADTTTYPRQLNSDGTVRQWTNTWDGTDTPYSLADSNLLAREKAALQAMDDHLASYDTAHTTIGIQVNNETASGYCNGDRSYDADTTAAYNAYVAAHGSISGTDFANYELAVRQNALAQVIKNGPYVTYTRMNLYCSDNINDFTTYSPDVDFIGYDPYTTSVSTIQKNIRPDQKLISIPENGPASSTGGTSNVPALMLAAYDSGAVDYATYQLAYEMNDSDPWNHITMVNLDHTDTSYARPAGNAVTQLGKDTQLLSRSNGVDLGYFYSSSSSYTTTKTLGPVTVKYATTASGSGVAETDQNSVYLMGLGASGTFTVAAPSTPTAASDGLFDVHHNWVKTGPASFTNNGDGTYSVTASSTQFIKLSFGSGLATATMTASTQANPGGAPSAAIDDSLDNAYVSADNPSFPQTLTETYAGPKNVSGVTVACEYCQGQGITDFDVQVSVDGTTNWTTVSSSGTLVYSTNSSTVESKTVEFPAQLQVRGLRLVVTAANLTWKHYAVNEMLPILNGPAYYYQIVNRGDGTYLNLESGGTYVDATRLGAPDWWSAQWVLSATSSQYLRFSNRNTGAYLHNQDDLSYLEHGSLGNSNWWSAQWKFIPTSSGYAQLQSHYLTGNYINLQNGLGHAEQGALGDPGSASSQWQFLPTR